MYHETECGCGQHGHGEKLGMGYGHGEWREHHGYPGGGWGHHSGSCSCGCHHVGGRYHGHGVFSHRHFISKEEIIAKLQEYLNQLQAEAKGVEEHIDALKKES